MGRRFTYAALAIARQRPDRDGDEDIWLAVKPGSGTLHVAGVPGLIMCIKQHGCRSLCAMKADWNLSSF